MSGRCLGSSFCVSGWRYPVASSTNHRPKWSKLNMSWCWLFCVCGFLREDLKVVSLRESFSLKKIRALQLLVVFIVSYAYNVQHVVAPRSELRLTRLEQQMTSTDSSSRWLEECQGGGGIFWTIMLVYFLYNIYMFSRWQGQTQLAAGGAKWPVE